MSHARTDIRGLIADALDGIAATTTNRVDPYVTLPSINIVTVEEEVVEDLDGVHTRELTLLLELRLKASAALDDQLDALALLVEEAMDGDAALNAGVDDLTLAGTEMELDGDSEQPVGVLSLNYTVTYRVASGAVGTIL